MIRFLTAGESHGSALLTIIEGFPSNLVISADYIQNHLKRRKIGYGRSFRQKMEDDKVEILSGIRFGKTLASPISLMIKNKDYKNWEAILSVEENNNKPDRISVPRPGHADLNGVIKYNFNDIRNSIERSSARETAVRVAAGTFARKLLEVLGIKVGSFVESIGGIKVQDNLLESLLENKTDFQDAEDISAIADKSEIRITDSSVESRILESIKNLKHSGNTFGGTFVVVVTGLPVGIGSYVHYDRKLDAALAASIVSINAVKAVEFGGGFNTAAKEGSEVQDEIVITDKKISRRTNYAGGIEGGISNGMPIIIRAAMKPIPTLMKPLKTIDLKDFSSTDALVERSDYTAVPACSVIAESMTAWTIASFIVEKFGGDSIEELKNNYYNYRDSIMKNLDNNFKITQ